MKWFFRWLYTGIKQVEQEDRDDGPYVPATTGNMVPRVRSQGMKIGLAKPRDEFSINLNQSPLTFRLYPATGGHIVEYAYYDEKTDRNSQALHLIPSDADLGESISKIMTLEALKR